MRKLILIIIIINLTNHGFAQFKLNEWIDQIKFEVPDTNNWIQISKFPAQKFLKGSIKFKHKPIVDSLGRPIEPVIALLYENSPDTIDLIVYSINTLANKPFKLNYKFLGGYPEYSSEKISVVYEGKYINSGEKHRLNIGYILHNDIVIEIICDATDGVYNEVEKEFKEFIKSVRLED